MENRACEFQPCGVKAYSSDIFRNTYTNASLSSENWFPGSFLAWGGISEHTYALIEVREGYVIEVETPYFRFVQIGG